VARLLGDNAVMRGTPPLLAAVALLTAVLPLSASQSPAPGDRAAVEAATLAYRDAWLANNAERVMATMTADAVIYPSTLPPIAGAERSRQFWFSAAGPATRVTAMQLTIDEVTIDGDMAVVSGRGSLTFVTTTEGVDSAPRSQRSGT
jgi:ketosteroid isomerase-like protein